MLAILTVKVSITSSWRGLFSTGCFQLKERSMCKLKTFFYTNFHTVKNQNCKARLNRFAWFKAQEREHSLSYFVVCVSCWYVIYCWVMAGFINSGRMFGIATNTVVSRKRATMDCPPIPQFCSCWGLKLIQESAYLVQPLTSHCPVSLRIWWDWFTHTTRCKLHSCTVVCTSTRCLVHDVTCYLHHFVHLIVRNIDSLNVSPPPSLNPG